ncbi:MAG: thiamine diphosphokinase [Proteobacteria bacterium]|nr:thiamine diphosphokinase [Pseudomonadota bacterium]
MLTVIFANGDLADTFDPSDILARSSLVIAVDGGANHCWRLGIIPDVLIGDLDSIDPRVLEEFQKKKVAIDRHPPRKDATDLELALDLTLKKGTRKVWLFGGLGGRWDMSLANVLLTATEKYKTLSFTIPGPGCIMNILHPGEPFTLHGAPGQRVSLLPLHGDVQGLVLNGFEYPLANATLLFGSTRGVSNVLQISDATVQFDSGVLLCIRLIPV